MGFGYIFIGFVFLSNPNINIIDIMPDFIGYSLILYGFSRLRDLAPAITDSFTGFSRLFIFSLLKTAILFIVSGLPDQGYLLVFAFVFTLAEVSFLLPAFSNFFDGMFFLGTMYNGNETVKRLTTAKSITVLFFILRGVFTLLPELIYLYVTEDFGYILADYKGVLNVISIIVVLVFGIIWLIHMRKFYMIIINDSHFINNMKTYYNEYIKPDTDLFLKRHMKYSFTLFMAGSLFLSDFYIDGIDFLPDTIGLLLFVAAVIISAKYMEKYKMLLTLSSVTALLSAGSWLYVKIFADRYWAFGIGKSLESYKMYLVTITISSFEAIFIIFLLIILTRYLLSLAKRHTGPKNGNSFGSMAVKYENRRKMMRIKIIAFCFLGIINAFSGIAYTVFLYTWPGYWMINLLLSIIWLIMTSRMFYELREEIERRYL